MATHIPGPDPAAISDLIDAASAHDITTLKALLKTTSAQVQDPDSMRTPLHATIASLSADATPEEATAAEQCVRELLFNGAIWNDLDAMGETPGCIAYRIGGAAKGCYQLMVEAGVRAEVLMGRMGGWGELESGDDSEEEQEEGEAPQLVEATDTPTDHVEAAEAGSTSQPKPATKEDDVTTERYMSSKLEYDDNKLLDSDNNGVMMAWETKIMERSVEELLPEGGKGKRVLNVGFGMGIVDGAFQAAGVTRHVICEPHPDVLVKLREDGWMDKPGVTILEGRWQEALPDFVATGETFDAIYFDTFAEPYSALKTFFNEVVISLLDPEGGRFGFFHGLGADRRISYDVYTRVVEMDLYEAGLETTWVDVEIDLQKDEWNGVKRRYWDIGNLYKLPVCQFVSY